MATGSAHSSLAKLLAGSSRYELLGKIASGGMATVFAGRLRGREGFWRLVAIKRAHPHLLEDPSFRRMLLDEARLASRLHHPNIVAVQDVEELSGELLLIMDYVEGTSLAELLWEDRGALEGQGDDAIGRPLDARAAVRIALDACAGLQAAHALCDERGEPMGLVHRDISPHNILVGVDGTARLADFGIAKCKQTQRATATGALKGKVAYMAPEYIQGGHADARSDIFALGVVVWESLARQRLFRRNNELETLRAVVSAEAPLLSSVAPWLGRRLDSVLARALEKAPGERYPSAEAFGDALESAARRDDRIGTASEVGAQVRAVAAPQIERRRAAIREQIAISDGTSGPPSQTKDLPRPASAPAFSMPRPHEVTPLSPREGRAATRTVSTAPGVSSVSSIGLLEHAGRPSPRQRWIRTSVAVAALLLLLGTGGGLALWIRPSAPPLKDLPKVAEGDPSRASTLGSAPPVPRGIVAPVTHPAELLPSAIPPIGSAPEAPKPVVRGTRVPPAKSGAAPKDAPLPPNPY